MKLLALDLSTTCTGYALIDMTTKQLIKYGSLKPNKKLAGVYPWLQLTKMQDLAAQIVELIKAEAPDKIAIEEVVLHKARLTGKVLDGLHFIIVDRLYTSGLSKVDYVDVIAWRQMFNIRLTEQDKLHNKEDRKVNKRLSRKEKKISIVDWKTLSSRYVNKRYGLELDPRKHAEHGDMADAILVGAYAVEKGIAC